MADIFIQNISEINLQNVWNELSDKRKLKIERLQTKEKKLLSAAVETALNKAVKAWFPESKSMIKYEYNENGKPYLKDVNAYISLSHSGDIAVCAISEKEVGVDIQKISAYNPDVSKRFFSSDEQKYINNAENKDKAFCEIWTKKESYVKMTGQGISKGFFNKNYENCQYEFHKISDKNYIICTCERKKR